MRNARFWVYSNGHPCKLTMSLGQTLSHSSCGPTDEGWSSCGDVWRYEGLGLAHKARVTREAWTDGRDCDGRLSTSTELECPIERLAAYNCGLDGAPMLPDWQRVSSRQRDYSAEAAGY